MMSHPFLRAVGGAFVAIAGWQAWAVWGSTAGLQGFIPWGLTSTLAGALLGGLLAPVVLLPPARSTVRVLQGMPAQRVVAAIFGLLLGLVVAALLVVPLGHIPGWPSQWLPVILSLLLGAAGVLVMVSRERDLVLLVPQIESLSGGRSSGKIVLDTSAIIDGRIADISQTGFLSGTLVIPRFVLDELRHIADSSDATRRNRGRRGLEILNRLNKDTDVPVQVLDVDRWNGMEVDGKLVMLAKSLGAPIVTTDFNLNRVAELQGVMVLNVNELANAVKSVVIPGEELQVRVIQEGKELGQGVGFLDDGTMVVVENGRRYVGSTIDATVTRVLQTAAGRLIFTQVKGR